MKCRNSIRVMWAVTRIYEKSTVINAQSMAASTSVKNSVNILSCRHACNQYARLIDLSARSALASSASLQEGDPPRTRRTLSIKISPHLQKESAKAGFRKRNAGHDLFACALNFLTKRLLCKRSRRVEGRKGEED
jgi:hypothetical protein